MSDKSSRPQRRHSLREELKHRFEYAGTLFSIFGIFGSTITLCLQFIFWLRVGVWPPWRIGDAFEFENILKPETEWLGVQHMIDTLWETPTYLSLLVVGFSLGFVLLGLANTFAARRGKSPNGPFVGDLVHLWSAAA